MANVIRVRRGLEANRSLVTPLEGELLYTTDEKKVYIGDGSTSGGIPVGNGDVVGPSSSTDNAIARYDGTTGKIIQSSSVYIDDDGKVGIGTTSPDSLLHIENTDVSGSPAIQLVNNGGIGGATYQMIDIGSGTDWKFKATATGQFKIRDNENAKDVIVIDNNATANSLYISPTTVGSATLAGTGNRMVIAGPTGTLSTQVIPTGSGDVVGPVSSSNEKIAVFDGTTGKVIKEVPVTITDEGFIEIAGNYELPINAPAGVLTSDGFGGTGFKRPDFGLAFSWMLDTVSQEPDFGYFRASTTDTSSLTGIEINFYDIDDEDIGEIIGNIVDGTILKISNVGRGEWALYKMENAAGGSSNWSSFPITHLSGTLGSLTNGTVYQLSFHSKGLTAEHITSLPLVSTLSAIDKIPYVDGTILKQLAITTLMSYISSNISAVTSISTGSGLDNSASTGSVSITLDFGELIIIGPGLIDPALDYFVVDTNYNGNNRLKFADTLLSFFDDDLSTTTSTANKIAKRDASGYLQAEDFVLGSDIRLKKDIREAEYTELKTEYKLFVYHKDESNRLRFGLIADELIKIRPQYVTEDENGMLNVSYIDVHSEEIFNLKEENKQIKKELAELREEMNNLKKVINNVRNR